MTMEAATTAAVAISQERKMAEIDESCRCCAMNSLLSENAHQRGYVY